MGSAGLSDVDLATRVARLTGGQRECLDLVDDHATSKEIARQLGISRHTVDARLRGAIQTLGVSSRREAAIIYRTAMQAQGYQPAVAPTAYQPFAYQSPQIVPEAPIAETSFRTRNEGEREGVSADSANDDMEGHPHANRMPPNAPSGFVAGPVGSANVHLAATHAAGDGNSSPMGFVSDSAVWTPASAADFGARRSLRLWGGANDLTPIQRMVGILVIMILAMLAFGLLLSGIEALTLLRT